MATDRSSAQTVLDHHAAQYGARSAARFDFAMRRIVFAGIDVEGRRVLDIGAGDGRMSMWAAAHGAERVVALEPEAAGSRSGVQERFRRELESAGLADRVEVRPQTLQEFTTDERFDVVLMAASINHLDEEACERLHLDEAARESYRGHFRRIAGLMVPGGVLTANDAAPTNLFQRLGIRNPLAPTIEWHKHQHPKLWIELLEDCGFTDPEVMWRSLNALGRPGITVLSNRPVSYLLTSSFRLKMRRAAA